jgi:hypothetical protein
MAKNKFKRFLIIEGLVLLFFILLGIASFIVGFHFENYYWEPPEGIHVTMIALTGLYCSIIGYPIYVVMRLLVWAVCMIRRKD